MAGPVPPAGATPLALETEPGNLLPAMGCPAALLAPARLAVAGDALVLVPESGGGPVRVVWLAWLEGLAPRREGGAG